VSAASIGLTATDNSSIDVETGAAAIAASFAGEGGFAISIGVGLAENTISNSVAAYILNADSRVAATSGGIVLSASETSSISSTAWAANTLLCHTCGILGLPVRLDFRSLNAPPG
jgi:hypothetical protein